MAPGNFCILIVNSSHWDMGGSKAGKVEGTKLQEALPLTETFLIISVSQWGIADR